jgi:hypothetical protein
MIEASTHPNTLPNHSAPSRWRVGLAAAAIFVGAGVAVGCESGEDGPAEVSFRLAGSVSSLDVDAFVDLSCEPSDDGPVMQADVELVTSRRNPDPSDEAAWYEPAGDSFTYTYDSVAETCDEAIASNLRLPLGVADAIRDRYAILTSERGTPEEATAYQATIEDRAADVETIPIQA